MPAPGWRTPNNWRRHLDPAEFRDVETDPLLDEIDVVENHRPRIPTLQCQKHAYRAHDKDGENQLKGVFPYEGTAKVHGA